MKNNTAAHLEINRREHLKSARASIFDQTEGLIIQTRPGIVKSFESVS